MSLLRHWLAESTGLVEPVRVIHGEATAEMYRKRGGWRVTGPFVPEADAEANAALRDAVKVLCSTIYCGEPMTATLQGVVERALNRSGGQ